MKQPVTEPLIPQPPNPPPENCTFTNLAMIYNVHMFILLVFAIEVRPTEFYLKYKIILLFLIATFEAFFGLAFLNCIIHDSNEYSTVKFSGFFAFILHGIGSNLSIYLINDHLFYATTIWWTFCLGILAVNIRTNFAVQLRSCLLPIANATVPPQKTTYVPNVTVTVPPHKTTI